MPDTAERITAVEVKVDAHDRADAVAFARINADTSEIKQTLRDMALDLKSAVERIHERVDEVAEKAQGANDKVIEQKAWVMSSVASLCLGIVAWLVDHFVVGKKG